MDTARFITIFFYLVTLVGCGVPPRVCFEPFNWNDCGRPPAHVLYYYKAGSRCEVGIWRGCLPNPNMFADQFECVNTCIYNNRYRSEDNDVMARVHVKDFPMEEEGLAATSWH